MTEPGNLFGKETQNSSFLIEVREVENSDIECAVSILLKLFLDMQLRRHYMLMHDGLALKVIII